MYNFLTSAHDFSRQAVRPSFWVLMAMLLGFVAPTLSAAVSLNAQEQEMARLLTTSSGQRRDRSRMVADSRLCQVARARAMDMARRHYFDHVNPDGNGANYLVRQAGYTLPSHYNQSHSGNNIESIGAGYVDAKDSWNHWMASSGHKTHLLATESFYRDQTTYGVGYYADSGSPYVRYYVILTAPPMGDTLTINTPSSGERVTTEQVTVTGEVSGSATVAQLQYRLENAAGTTPWQAGPLPSGASVGNYSARVSGLRLGNNTIRVRTLDNSGAAVKETLRTVRLAVMKPLVVALGSEGGTVSTGFLGTTNREAGAAYTIAAAPKAGYIFDHWEGLPQTANLDVFRATQSFTMAEGITLRVFFAPNPFLTKVGKFQGLLGGGDGSLGQAGVVRVTLNKSGVYSGHFILGSVRYPVQGRLNSQGVGSLTVPRPGQTPIVLALQLDLTAAVPSLVASVTADGQTLVADAGFSTPVAADSTQAAQRFTFRIAPDASVPASPQGYGMATATIRPNGVVSIAGNLADGRAFTSSATATADGRFALFVPFFSGKGALTGDVQASTAGVTGELHWFKPARAADLRNAAAFSSTHTLTGELYVAPVKGERILPLGTNGQGVLTLVGADLADSLSQALTLGTDHAFHFAPVTVRGLQITANPASGIIKGTFRAADGTLCAFRAQASVQDNAAYGYILGSTATGALSLEAAE